MKKLLLTVIGLALCVLTTEAATTIKFFNHTAVGWSGVYFGTSYALPPGVLTQWTFTVTEPGAWCFDFGPVPSHSGSGFGSDTFNEDYEGYTFEYHGYSETFPSDKGPEFPDDIVYTWTQITYPTTP